MKKPTHERTKQEGAADKRERTGQNEKERDKAREWDKSTKSETKGERAEDRARKSETKSRKNKLSRERTVQHEKN